MGSRESLCKPFSAEEECFLKAEQDDVAPFLVIWVMKNGPSVDLRLQQTPTDFALLRLQFEIFHLVLLLLSFDLKVQVHVGVTDAP